MARVTTRTSLSCSSVAGASLSAVAFGEGWLAEADSFDFFFSCLARSSAFVSLVNAIVFPSGAQLGFAAPFGRSVKTNESPPVIERIASCGGSGLPFFSVVGVTIKKKQYVDHQGEES